jgi:hypothetical protein
MATVWRREDAETEDYPGLWVHDGRVSGSITVSQSRLPLWAFAGWDWDEVVASWDYIETEYGWTEDRQGEFLHNLLEARGEFGRLLLTIADMHRIECERDDVTIDQAAAEGHPAVSSDGGLVLITPGDPNALRMRGWWEHDDLRARMVAQLQACIDLLEDEPSCEDTCQERCAHPGEFSECEIGVSDDH